MTMLHRKYRDKKRLTWTKFNPERSTASNLHVSICGRVCNLWSVN